MKFHMHTFSADDFVIDVNEIKSKIKLLRMSHEDMWPQEKEAMSKLITNQKPSFKTQNLPTSHWEIQQRKSQYHVMHSFNVYRYLFKFCFSFNLKQYTCFVHLSIVLFGKR